MNTIIIIITIAIVLIAFCCFVLLKKINELQLTLAALAAYELMKDLGTVNEVEND